VSVPPAVRCSTTKESREPLPRCNDRSREIRAGHLAVIAATHHLRVPASSRFGNRFQITLCGYKITGLWGTNWGCAE